MTTNGLLQQPNPRTDESLEERRRLTHLRPTSDLVADWNDLQGRLGMKPPPLPAGFRRFSEDEVTQDDVDRAAMEIQRGMDRDALQETRPDGCWCLGLGGRGTAVIRRMAYFDPEDVFSEFCDCAEGQAERLRVQQAKDYRAEIALRFLLDRHWDTCGIPKRFRSLRLATSPLRESMPDLITRLLPPEAPTTDSAQRGPEWDDWSNRDEEWRRSWFFWGDYGVGKTGLAAGYAWEYLQDTEGNIMFRSIPDLLAELRATYNRPRRRKQEDDDGEAEADTEAALIDRLSTVDLLILDDLGAEQVKETGDGSWVADRLFQIIGKRHADELTTVFTSNLNIAQLAARIGERLAWRIVEMCGKDHVIHIEGRNLRAE